MERQTENILINCPGERCDKRLRVPCGQGPLNVTCPACRTRFKFDEGDFVETKEEQDESLTVEQTTPESRERPPQQPYSGRGSATTLLRDSPRCVQTSRIDEQCLLDVLSSSPTPLSTRQIAIRLRRRRMCVADYEVTRGLRHLLRSGRLQLKRGRWFDNRCQIEGRAKPAMHTTTPPVPSPELQALLRDSTSSAHTETEPVRQENTSDERILSSETENCAEGRWSNFRQLLAYYRQCVRAEEGAEASAYANQLGERFLYLQKSGYWEPRTGKRWQMSLPLGAYMSVLLRTLTAAKDDQPIVLGYPLQGVYIPKEGEPDLDLVQPVFYVFLNHFVSNGNLVVFTDNPRFEINLGWLEHAFPGNPSGQRSFLSACGLINRSHSDNEIPSLEKNEQVPGVRNLTTALAAFMSERVREELHPDSISNTPIGSAFETGIYNRAVLMLAKRTRYTETLLKELAAIERFSDDELDNTALRYIFARDSTEITHKETENLVHEATVADTTNLNAEQRRAVASLMAGDITVITGPPGTGKSQVVSSSISNARLVGQTVLFASRNHKAIDAVFNRLTDSENRNLIIRTNSKDDPNLNYTFNDAIRELLANPIDPFKTANLTRTPRRNSYFTGGSWKTST